jgi:hypothetical protein
MPSLWEVEALKRSPGHHAEADRSPKFLQKHGMRIVTSAAFSARREHDRENRKYEWYVRSC